ncbi:hypothetical protein ACFL5J_00290 [Thermodesulfobacteriota bacterium]
MAFDDTKIEIFLPVTVVGIVTALISPVLQENGLSFLYSVLVGALFALLLVAVVAIMFKIVARKDDNDKQIKSS